jgi:alpha-tubulin suppressor-like RCC1 family protein
LIIDYCSFPRNYIEEKFMNKQQTALFILLVTLLVLNFGSISFAATPQVIASHHSSYALKDDGTVWAWGSNYYGNLGDGTTINSLLPIKVYGLSDIIAISAGSNHAMALKNDGTVWAWGDNLYGRLGDGTTTDSYTPVRVIGLADVASIAAGESHSLALKNDGTVWAWGNNYAGGLGDGTTTNRYTPIQVFNLYNVRKISAGSLFSLALKNDGTCWAWGRNWSGRLGDGTTTDRYTPVQVVGMNDIGFLSDLADINAALYYSLVIKRDRTVWGWGNNHEGQLGDGTTTDRYTPVQAFEINDAKTISSKWYSTFVLKNDSTVLAWGLNSQGQLGDGTTVNRLSPIQVSGLSGVYVISAGNTHAIALKEDGTVWAWGDNLYGKLGDGTQTNRYSPIQVLNLNLGSVQKTAPNLSAIYSLLLSKSSGYDFFEDFKTPTGWNSFLQEYANWFDASQHQSPSVEWNDPSPGDSSGYQVEIINDQSYLRMKTEGGTYDRLKLMTNKKYTTGTYEWKVYFPNNMLEANGEGANTAYGAWLYDSFNTGREIDFEIGWGPRWQRQEAGLSDSDEKLLVHMTVQPSDSIIGDWEQPDGQLRTKCAVIDSGYWYTFKLILSNQNGNYLVEWYFKKEGEEYDSSPAHVFSCPYGPDDTSFHICVSNENFPPYSDGNTWLGDNAPPMEPHHTKFDFVRYRQ